MVSQVGTVVKYGSKVYLLYKINRAGKCQLLNREYVKQSGTPLLKNVQALYRLPVVSYDNRQFILTKTLDIISSVSGNVVYKNKGNKDRTNLINLFNKLIGL